MNTLRTLIITIPAVRNISRNGEVIILDDHSVYLIDTMDHLKTRNWERHHSIRVIPKGSKCVLLNYNTGDQVSADSARPCSPAIGRDVTPRANSFTSSVSAPSGLSYTISSTGKRRSAQRGSLRSVGEFHNASALGNPRPDANESGRSVQRNNTTSLVFTVLMSILLMLPVAVTPQ